MSKNRRVDLGDGMRVGISKKKYKKMKKEGTLEEWKELIRKAFSPIKGWV